MDAVAWQEALVAQNARWYPGTDAPQVAAAFALQYLLQVPAHTLGYAVRLAERDPSRPAWLPVVDGLEFTIGPNLVPDRVRLASAGSAPMPSSERTLRDWAERHYRAIAEPLATAYPSIVRMGTGTRLGMVSDMWAGALSDGPVPRESCCFLYALPGCHECAGCPRLR